MEPILNPIKAKAHTAQYKVHKYFARRPYNVFSNLISHYTAPQDIILDCFCGGGVTVAESLKLDRKVVGVDLNPLASFISEMQVQQLELESFKEFATTFIKKCHEKYEHFYELNLKGDNAKIVWVEYAYSVNCPVCNSPCTLSDENKIRNGVYKCSNRECDTNSRDQTLGFKRTKATPLSTVPLRAKVIINGEKKVIAIDSDLQQQILSQQSNHILDDDLDTKIPTNWDRTLEDCLYEKGVDKFSSLFTNKNLHINLSIFDDIINLRRTAPSEYIDLLYFAFSASLRYTNKMSRVTANWENGNPTCMDKHAYWLPNVFVETNILDYLQNRISALIKNIKYTNENFKNEKHKANDFFELYNDKDYLVLNQSSSDLDIPNKSVNLVLTDPPYGSNVQYAELSSYWNIWLKKYKGLNNFIYNDEEAITHRKKKETGFKSLKHYETILTSVYTECNRVLKDNGYLVFTFNNKDINVWIALLSAIAKSGFYLPHQGVIFQEFIDSYKNTSHLRFEGNIRGDFIYSFKKRDKNHSPIDYSGQDLYKLVSNQINKTVSELDVPLEGIGNTELYTEVFTQLINLILDYVLSNPEECVIETAESAFKSQFIDNNLAKYLNFKEGKWLQK